MINASVEGRGLMEYLRKANGPFLAFHRKIPDAMVSGSHGSKTPPKPVPVPDDSKAEARSSGMSSNPHCFR